MGSGKRTMGIRARLFLGFGLFTLVTVLLLWVFQIALLNPFYRYIKISQVENAVDRIAAVLDSDALEDTAQDITLSTGTSVLISDELGSEYIGYKLYAEKYSSLDMLKRGDLRDIFNEVNLMGGTRIETYTTLIPFTNETMEVVVFSRTVRTDEGNNRLILMEAELTPVSSTVGTLKVQLVCITAVMILLGVGLALLISLMISKPITSINESAKRLGSGDYNIRFEESGAREVKELGHTLNYAAQELSKADNMKKELIANVSHDLRTPLTMIKGYGEVMRDIPGENTPENVQIIIDEAARLTDLVNDLLDLSKLESGKVDLDRTYFNLTESVRNTVKRYEKLVDYSFYAELAEDVFVYADELKISQVVYNLINNAVAYTGEDKRVFISQSTEGERVRISVSDTGEGIPADKLKDIWERYYKVDKTHKRTQIGTGLGLFIVKNVLELHGGSYGVISEPDVGSTFWFELDTAKPPFSSGDGENMAEA